MMISGLHLSAVFGFAAAETWTVRLSSRDEKAQGWVGQGGRLAGALLELSTSGSLILSPPPGFPFLGQQQTILRIIEPTSLGHTYIECFQSNKTDKKNRRTAGKNKKFKHHNNQYCHIHNKSCHQSGHQANIVKLPVTLQQKLSTRVHGFIEINNKIHIHYTSFGSSVMGFSDLFSLFALKSVDLV